MSYLIIRTRHWYGNQVTTSLAKGADGHPMEFATRKQARAAVKQLEEAVYYLAQNESGRPTFSTTSTKSATGRRMKLDVLRRGE